MYLPPKRRRDSPGSRGRCTSTTTGGDICRRSILSAPYRPQSGRSNSLFGPLYMWGTRPTLRAASCPPLSASRRAPACQSTDRVLGRLFPSPESKDLCSILARTLEQAISAGRGAARHTRPACAQPRAPLLPSRCAVQLALPCIALLPTPGRCQGSWAAVLRCTCCSGTMRYTTSPCGQHVLRRFACNQPRYHSPGQERGTLSRRVGAKGGKMAVPFR